MLIHHSLCDASPDADIALKGSLHTVDETTFPHIRKTWGGKKGKHSDEALHFKEQDKISNKIQFCE